MINQSGTLIGIGFSDELGFSKKAVLVKSSFEPNETLVSSINLISTGFGFLRSHWLALIVVRKNQRKSEKNNLIELPGNTHGTIFKSGSNGS